MPSIEPADSEQPRLLATSPLDLMMNAQFNRGPIMMSFNDAEALFQINTELPEDTDDVLTPLLWNIPAGSPARAEIGTTFRNFYWNGAPISDSVRFNYMEVNNRSIIIIV